MRNKLRTRKFIGSKSIWESSVDGGREEIFVDTYTNKAYVIRNGKFVEVDVPPEEYKLRDLNGDTRNGGYDPLFPRKDPTKFQQVQELYREAQLLKEQIYSQFGGHASEVDIFGDTNYVANAMAKLRNAPESVLDRKLEELRVKVADLRREIIKLGGTPVSDDMEVIRNKQRDIDDIKKMFDDPKIRDEILTNTRDRVNISRQQKLAGERAAKEVQRKATAPDEEVLMEIRNSLYQTLKSEVREMREYSWSKFNKKAHAAGLLAPGVRLDEQRLIPSINVYFDRSASWGPAKSLFGQQAVDAIATLANQKKIKMNLYYFNDKVRNTDPGFGNGGTYMLPVLEHIKATKPQNVFIMTDADFQGQSGPTVVVPGAVWYLFKDIDYGNYRQLAEAGEMTLQEKLIGKRFSLTYIVR